MTNCAEADNARGGADLQDRAGGRRGGRQVQLHLETVQEQVRLEPQLHSRFVNYPQLFLTTVPDQFANCLTRVHLDALGRRIYIQYTVKTRG